MSTAHRINRNGFRAIIQVTMMLMPPLSSIPPPSQATDSSWKCHKCHHSNTNKSRCSKCKKWRDGVVPFRRANCHANFESNAARGSSSDENADPNISLSTSSCRDLPTKSSNDNILLCGRLESDKNASIPIPTSSSLPPTSSTLLSLALTSPPSSQSLSLVSCSPMTPLPPSSCLATLC